MATRLTLRSFKHKKKTQSLFYDPIEPTDLPCMALIATIFLLIVSLSVSALLMDLDGSLNILFWLDGYLWKLEIFVVIVKSLQKVLIPIPFSLPLYKG